jgi:hypothetical protein
MVPWRALEFQYGHLPSDHDSIPGTAASLDLFDNEGKQRGLFRVNGSVTSMGIFSSMGSKGTKLLLETGNSVAKVTLADEKGFTTELGSTRVTVPQTGENQLKSAASVMMFDKKGNVIWAAP